MFSMPVSMMKLLQFERLITETEIEWMLKNA
ncbi:Gamma-glutamyl-putrescine synthetase [Klebsiella pneumoniae]|nr:Gamma-glutamyl-putrescine synthetase [Klebsiella pneumoniae]